MCERIKNTNNLLTLVTASKKAISHVAIDAITPDKVSQVLKSKGTNFVDIEFPPLYVFI